MRRPLAFVLAFFIVFAPVYANAVLPALIASAASSATGRVLVGSAVKKVAPVAITNARKSLLGICKVRPDICLGVAGGILQIYNELTEDGYTVEAEKDPVTNIYNIDIYKINEGLCETQIGFGYPPVSESANNNRTIAYLNKQGNGTYIYSTHSKSSALYKTFIDRYKNALKEVSDWIMVESAVPFPYVQDGWNGTRYAPYNPDFKFSDRVSIRCVPYPANKTYITDNQLNQIIQNNQLTDNEFLNIYNFDYSQHGDVNIGGNTYNGNTINNDLSLSVDPELKVSPSLKLKINSKKYSIDDVNDENCKKNDVGDYDQCGEQTEPEEPEPEEPPIDSPIECDANGFYRKICDWMDWTQKKPSKPTFEPVDVVDVEAENSNKIDMSGECPAPYELSFNVLGYQQNHSISYEPLCNALVMLKPIFIGSGALSGMFILMGYNRPNGDN